MTGAATVISEAFGEEALKDLYQTVLNVSSDATKSQLRKAYHKQALKYHPDKLRQSSSSKKDEEIDNAKRKFQAISITYQILSNDDSRKEYDEHGELIDDDDDDDNDNDNDKNKSGYDYWRSYFTRIFPKINLDDIDKFSTKYRHSKEERDDVLRYYVTTRGNLNQMVDCVMCSTMEDKARWMKEYIEPAIKKGDVDERYHDNLERTLGDDDEDDDDDDDNGEEDDDNEELVDTEDDDEEEESSSSGRRRKKKGTTTTTKKNNKKKDADGSSANKKRKASSSSSSKKKKESKREREAREAEELIAKIRGGKGDGNGNSLAKRREEGFNSLISDLESRYSSSSSAKGKKGNKKKKVVSPEPPEDIPDDEFEKIQARLLLNAKNKKKRKT